MESCFDMHEILNNDEILNVVSPGEAVYCRRKSLINSYGEIVCKSCWQVDSYFSMRCCRLVSFISQKIYIGFIENQSINESYIMSNIILTML